MDIPWFCERDPVTEDHATSNNQRSRRFAAAYRVIPSFRRAQISLLSRQLVGEWLDYSRLLREVILRCPALALPYALANSSSDTRTRRRRSRLIQGEHIA